MSLGKIEKQNKKTQVVQYFNVWDNKRPMSKVKVFPLLSEGTHRPKHNIKRE